MTKLAVSTFQTFHKNPVTDKNEIFQLKMAKNGKPAPAQQNPQSVKQRLGPVKPNIKLGVIRYFTEEPISFC